VSRTLKYYLGEYELDPNTYSLSRGSIPAPVSRKRFEVLLYLVKERNRVVTRPELIERFWDGHEVYEENLTKCISELRRALDDQQKPHRCIETVPAVGYRYTGTVEEHVSTPESSAINPINNETIDAVVLAAHEVPQNNPGNDVRRLPTMFNVALLLAFIALAAVGVTIYLRNSISERVAQTLAARLSTPEKERLAKHDTDNGEAYQLYQKGRYFWNKRTEDGLVKSIAFLEQATKVDPKYATAYAGLADAYLTANNFNLLPPGEVYSKAKYAAHKAIEIDNSLAEAHAALAFATMLFDWDWTNSELEFRKAIELSPNYGPAHQWYAVGLVGAGRFDEAVAEARKAQHADPLSLFINAGTGWVSFLVRDYDRTIAECTKTIEMEPGFAPAHLYRAMAYEQKGMFDKAIADLETASNAQGGASFSGALGHAYAIAGKKAEARMLLRDLKESSAKHYFPPYQLALIHVGLGEKEEALNLLEKAYEEHYPWMIHLSVEPRFDPLRSEPRFKALVSRIGLGQPAESVATSANR
jgi:DNA-binding winged helix-turn-helix (wHTH) protein/Flp pilus assembly protein TadD